MKFCYVILLSFCVFVADAQVPGFLGKRFTLFVDANPTPALFVQNINNTVIVDTDSEDGRTDNVNRFAFNVRPQVTAEYLIHRNVALGFSYGRLMMGTVHSYYTGPDTGDEYDYRQYEVDKDVIKGQQAGIHIKLYHFGSSSSLPPIGYYQTFSLYITQSNTYDDKKSKVKQFKNDFVYPVASFSIGRQTMIAKNLLLKTGVEFGWAFVPMNFLTESTDDWNVQEYAGYNAHQSLFGYYMFNLNVGLGYTLF